MNQTELETGIARIVRHNGELTAGETVAIISDPPLAEIADCLEKAVEAISPGNVKRMTIPTRQTDGEEPPPEAAAIMREAKVIFSPVSRSITHTKAMKEALKNGARAVLMTAHNERVITSPALMITDFNKVKPLCHHLGERLRAGSSVRVTTEKGTDITFSIKDRPVNVLTGVPGPGDLAPIPTIEVNVVPVTGSAEGTIVADASIPYLGIGVLEEPVICTVREGRIVKIRGGKQAEFLKQHWAELNNPNVYNVAELGIGLNPNATLTGDMLIDEGVVGTIHWGIGTSLTLGGEVSAPTHYDLLTWHPTIEIDGEAFMEKDRFPSYSAT